MKFSTVGTNWITEMFIEAAKQNGTFELCSVYSRKEETATMFANKHGAEKSYTDFDLFLNDDAHFVYIASPNILHPKQVRQCIEKGKHVFCEKPLAYTETQVTEIKNHAKEKGVFVFEGYRHLFSPNYEVLKQSLGKVGQVRSVLLQYIKYSSRYDAYKEGKIANVFSKEFAGGVLMDLGVYPLSMALDLFGEPVNIAYFPVFLSNGIDGSGTVVLTYPNFTVTIIISKIANSMIASEIHGEDGTLKMDAIAPISELTFYHKNEGKFELGKPQSELDMIYELKAFQQMIEKDDRKQYEQWLERSRQVAKWTEKARHQCGLLFPGE